MVFVDKGVLLRVFRHSEERGGALAEPNDEESL